MFSFLSNNVPLHIAILNYITFFGAIVIVGVIEFYQAREFYQSKDKELKCQKNMLKMEKKKKKVQH